MILKNRTVEREERKENGEGSQTSRSFFFIKIHMVQKPGVQHRTGLQFSRYSMNTFLFALFLYISPQRTEAILLDWNMSPDLILSSETEV